MASKWSSIFGVVAKLAPTVAQFAGGPLASSAVSALEGALKLTPSGDVSARQDAVATALQGATQDQLLAVQVADNQFKEQMAQLGIQSAKDVQVDIASARTMHTATRESTPTVLSYAITAGFFGLLTLMLFHAIPQSATSILDIMTGALGAAWTGMVSFWFGSSSDSSVKTQLLANSTPLEKK